MLTNSFNRQTTGQDILFLAFWAVLIDNDVQAQEKRRRRRNSLYRQRQQQQALRRNAPAFRP